jgi:CheY-like chemotaxis protein
MSLNRSAIRVLVLDDEPAFLNVYRKVLDPQAHVRVGSDVAAGGDTETVSPSLPCELVCCDHGEKAIELFTESVEAGDPFAIVFLDMFLLVGPDGLDVAKAIRKLHPRTYLVIATGRSEVDPRDIALEAPPSERLLYLRKPFHVFELQQLVSALGQRWLHEPPPVNAERVQYLVRGNGSVDSDVVALLRDELDQAVAEVRKAARKKDTAQVAKHVEAVRKTGDDIGAAGLIAAAGRLAELAAANEFEHAHHASHALKLELELVQNSLTALLAS